MTTPFIFYFGGLLFAGVILLLETVESKLRFYGLNNDDYSRKEFHMYDNAV